MVVLRTLKDAAIYLSENPPLEMGFAITNDEYSHIIDEIVDNTFTIEDAKFTKERMGLS